MDHIAQQLASRNWTYGDGDPSALALMKEKIAQTGRKAGLLTYGQLLRGITFRLRNPDSVSLQIVATVDTTDAVENVATITAGSPLDPDPSDNEVRVTVIAENMLTRTPSASVRAKPLTRLAPNWSPNQ